MAKKFVLLKLLGTQLMLDTEKYIPRLRLAFDEKIRSSMKEEFSYKNDMQIPRLDKIVLNIGAGREAVKDSKKVKSAQEDLTIIAGQKAVITKPKNLLLDFVFVRICHLVLR